MDNTKFEFSFPLVTNYKIDMYSQKQNGFYEYSTDYRIISIDEVFKE